MTGDPDGRVAYLNGAWVDEASAAVSIHDRGFLFGDGVYESVRLHRGGYFRFHDHYDRLADGAAVLRIRPPPAPELAALARELAERNRLTDATLRVMLTRGPGGRGLGTVGAGPPTLLLTLRPIPEDWERRAARGWHVVTSGIPHPSAQALPAQLKTQNRLFAILARLEADEAGADDALLLADDGIVTEGPTWNVFWRRGSDLFTPALEAGILAGITRGVVLEIAAELGFTVRQGRWPRAELDRAEEAFATLSSLGVVPFRRLDDRDLAEADRSGSRLLFRAYWDFVAAELDGRPA